METGKSVTKESDICVWYVCFKRWENYSNGHSLHMVKLVIYYLLHTWGVRKSAINNRPLCVFWGRIYWAKIWHKSAIFLEVAFVKKKNSKQERSDEIKKTFVNKNYHTFKYNCTIFPILSLLCLGGRQSFLERNGRKVVSHLFVALDKDVRMLDSFTIPQ